MRSPAISMLVLLIAGGGAHSESSGATGVGTGTCAIFASHYRGDPKLAELVYGSWAQGFLAGLNLSTREARNIAATTAREQFAYLRRYCDEHPLALMMDPLISEFYSFPKLHQ